MSTANLTKGIILIILGALWFTLMSAIGKLLLPYYHPLQIVFLRNFGTLLISCFYLNKSIKSIQLAERRWMLIARGIISQLAVTFWFLAIAHATLPEVTAISFSTPIFAALAAWQLLGEKISLIRWLGIAVGLAGIIFIIHPNLSTWQDGYIYALLASVCWALNAIVIKSLSAKELPETIIFSMMLVMSILSLPGAILHWHIINPRSLLLITLLCITTFLWQASIAVAYRHGEVNEIQPFEYSRLIFACLVSTLLFGEALHRQVIIGAIIVMGSGLIGFKRKPLANIG